MIYTDVGFHLKSGFKKIVLTPEWISVLNLNSRKNCLHQIYLYMADGERQIAAPLYPNIKGSLH